MKADAGGNPHARGSITMASMKFLMAALWLAAAAAPSQNVDFARDVQPILQARCSACHMGDKREAGLWLHTRADILKGGQGGAAVIPGNSKESLLIQRVTGFRAPRMPLAGEHLGEREIGILQAWIDQGAQAGAAAGTVEPRRPLALRRPELPEADSASPVNPLDRFLAAYLRKRGLETPPAVPDAVFARRAWLDVWGVPPPPEQLLPFLGQPEAGKRERLAEQLLADRKIYSEHWISFWNDLLRNDEGVVYHGARQSITSWLLLALENNLPYNQFVSALLNPAGPGDPAGFLVGVNWRGDVNASQTPPMQAAQNTAQVFLGVNLKCNSCHDSFISSWKLKDAYGWASFFAERELEIARCDAATGEKASPQFLFPELVPAGPLGAVAERRAEAARLVTSPANGRFARTLVNRVWKRLLGRGLVEPVDDLDAEPFDPELLEWLAADFVDHGYDLKLLLRRILTSRAYQLPAVRAAGAGSDYVFRGPLERRLTAEQFVDSMSAVTGEWRVLPSSKPGPGRYSREWRLKSSPLTRALGRPIRDQVYTERSQEPATLQALEMVNGETLDRLLRRGAARLLGRLRPAPPSLFDSGVVRAEKVVVDIDISQLRQLRLLIEDADSYDRGRVVAGWAEAELVSPSGVVRLSELARDPATSTMPLRIRGQTYAETLIAPVPSHIVYPIGGKGFTRFRAVAGVDEGSQKSDINPRVRFFVFAEEPEREQMVSAAAETPFPASGPIHNAAALTRFLYRYALSREPSRDEERLAQDLLAGDAGGSIRAEGLEDLLWSIFLSPEFQYIR